MVQTCDSIIGFEQAIWSCKTKIVSIKCGRCFARFMKLFRNLGLRVTLTYLYHLTPSWFTLLQIIICFPNCRKFGASPSEMVANWIGQRLDDGDSYPMEIPCCGCVNMSSPAPQKHVNCMQLHIQMISGYLPLFQTKYCHCWNLKFEKCEID